MVEKTVHYKLRKKKKQWVAVGITVVSGVFFVTTLNSQSVQAAEVDQTSNTTIAATLQAASSGTADATREASTTEQSTTLTTQATESSAAQTTTTTASPAVSEQATPQNEPVTVAPKAQVEQTVSTQVVAPTAGSATAADPSETTQSTQPAATVQPQSTTVSPVEVPANDTVTTTTNPTPAPVTEQPTVQTPTATNEAQMLAVQTPTEPAVSATTTEPTSSTVTTATTDKTTTSSTDLTATTPVAPVAPSAVSTTNESTAQTVVPNQSNAEVEPTPTTQGIQNQNPVTNVTSNQTASAPTDSAVVAKTTTSESEPAEATPVQSDALQLADLELAAVASANEVPGSPQFNISNTAAMQWSYTHPALNQVSGAHAWQDSDYANQIAMDAKGQDATTGQYYIDEWMPDYAFQYVLWDSAYADKYATINDFRANFTKNDLAQLQNLSSSAAKQITGSGSYQQVTTYYNALMAMYSLEGLQNATGLKTLSIAPTYEANALRWGTATKNGNLFDISALKNLNQLQTVNLPMFSIDNVSALAEKPDLTQLNLSYNQIADISPLQTNRNPALKASYKNQHLLLQPIVLKDGTTTFETPSFIVKDLNAQNVPVAPYDGAGTYASPYPSNADGSSVNQTTVGWENILTPDATHYGAFTVNWVDPSSDFTGWFIQPYEYKQGIGNVKVNYQLLQADGKQITIAPGSVLAGGLGSSFDLIDDPVTVKTLNSFLSQSNYHLLAVTNEGKYVIYTGQAGSQPVILDGTGQLKDLATKQADLVSNVGKFGDTTPTYTFILVKDWNVNVKYGVIDLNSTPQNPTDLPKNTPVVENGTTVPDQTITGNLSNQIVVGDLVKDYPDLTIKEILTSNDGKVWTKLATGTTEIPFIDSNQTVYVLYTQAGYAQVKVVDKTTNQELTLITNATDPSLKGEAGTQSTFDKDAAIKDYLANGYQFDSDDFAQGVLLSTDATKPNNYTIYLTHKMQTSTVQNNYVVNFTGADDKTPQPETTTLTWQAVKDLVSGQMTYTPSKSSVTFQVPTIDGYTPDQTQVNFTPAQSSTQPTDEQTTVTYKKDVPVIQIGTVTYYYQDAAGNELLQPVTFSGDVGAAYPDRVAQITGYHLQSVTGNRTGQIAKDPITVTYIYAKDSQPESQKGQVTVAYHDEMGQALLPNQVITGNVGDPYTTDQATISGYHFVRVTGNPNGTITKDPIDVTYVYAQDAPEAAQGTVVVHYQDEAGQLLLADRILDGQVGTAYSTQAATIANYRLARVNGDATGTYTKDPIEVTYVYTPDKRPDISKGTVTVHYQDQNGTALQPAVVITGNVGNDYTTAMKTIAGYHLKNILGEASGQITTQPLDVTYVYQADAPATNQGTVVVHYHDNTGNPILPDQTITGTVGGKYTVKEQPIAGYVLTKVTGALTGTLTDTPIEITFSYAKINPAQPAVPDTPKSNPTTDTPQVTTNVATPLTTTPATEKGNALTAQTPVQSNKTPVEVAHAATPVDQVLTGQQAKKQLVAGEKTYPQTGEKTNHFGLLGAMLIGLAGLFGVERKKKEE
ncbi:MucBP domain-containing protein [Enterococcus sp. CSURQ0835]|uniref:MucBP domain-containing protein n=1 Tax=Enterococcus sp. CSURQ0835 TaxID=2681394 RepID=UPI00135A7BC7|nr:MucBP domain-containing protein [Enterococcus sp. CSURQ0835]